MDVAAIDSVDFDYWLPSLSLPRLLNYTPEQINGQPFLSSSTFQKSNWSEIWKNLHQTSKPRVGLVWQGNPKYKEDRYRSLQGHMLKTLLQNKDYHFVTNQFSSVINVLTDTPYTMYPVFQTVCFIYGVSR